MNLARRKLIAEAADLIGRAITLLEIARDEEQDYFDNMPEAIQAGDKGDRATEVVDALEEAIDTLEGIDLQDAQS